MLADLELSTSLLCCLITFLTLYLIINFTSILKGLLPSKASKLPRSFPIVGSYFSLIKNIHRFSDWSANIVNSQPSSTFILHRALGQRQVITSNPSNVQHILKTNFHVYQKGTSVTSLAYDFLGRGIFNVDGDSWKFQRQISSHEFNTKSLMKFVVTVVDTELFDRLLPIMNNAAVKELVLDFQDILQRFAFDNICNIAFGYDPEYLLPSLPEAKFAVAFENTTTLITTRFRQISPLVWKIQKFFNTGLEKELKKSIEEVREFGRKVTREKMKELQEKSELHDWQEFRPERWLEMDGVTGKWCFIGRDQHTYPVFQAGLRVYLGKEMAFFQMKRVVAGVLPPFSVIPVIEKGKEAVFTAYLTAKMHGGFLVRIKQRA